MNSLVNNTDHNNKFLTFSNQPADYEIEKILGKGAHGEVSQAVTKINHRSYTVAIKKNHKSNYYQKIINEEKIIWQLHRNQERESLPIIHFFTGFDIDQEQRWSIYEAMDGDLCSKDFPNTLFSLRELAKQMFSALKHMQKLDIVHLDIKPDNILFKIHKEKATTIQFKLSDFGFAVNRNVETNARLLAVSSPYRPIELALATVEFSESSATRKKYQEKFNHAIHPAADIWSLGVTLATLYLKKPNLVGIAPGMGTNHRERFFDEQVQIARKIVLFSGSFKKSELKGCYLIDSRDVQQDYPFFRYQLQAPPSSSALEKILSSRSPKMRHDSTLEHLLRLTLKTNPEDRILAIPNDFFD